MEKKQGISAAYRKLVLPSLIITCVILILIGCTGCGSSGLNSDENIALLESHALFSLELKANNLPKHVEGSWLAVQRYYDENNEVRWSIIGSSEDVFNESMLSELDILVVISSTENSAQYRGGGKVSIGTSEYAYLDYYDARTGDCYGNEMLSAGALPDKTTSVPNYTLSDRKIIETIEKRISSRIDPDYNTWAFVMDGTLLLDVNAPDRRGIAIPEYITEISEKAASTLQDMENLCSIALPEKIETINLPDMHEKVTLGVYGGSYAERYAVEKEYVYYHIGTLDGYLPEGVYEIDSVPYDGGHYGYLHVPSSVTYINDVVFKINAVFVVSEGSYAEQAAIESKHAYCYEGAQDCIYIPEKAYFSIPASVMEFTATIHLPDSIYFNDDIKYYLKENAAHLTFIVPKGSYTESYAIENGIAVENR